MIIIGLSDKNLQERLSRENNVSLDRTVEICRTVEITRSQANIIQNGAPSGLNVHEIRKNHHPVNNNQPRTYSPEMINKCKFCSYSHKRGSCQAYGKIYNNCKKKDIFLSAVLKRENKSIKLNNKMKLNLTKVNLMRTFSSEQLKMRT